MIAFQVPEAGLAAFLNYPLDGSTRYGLEMGMFDLREMNGTLGAEVSGIQLARDIGDDTVDKLAAALADHKVLIFRDQTGLDAPALLRFAERFGQPELEPHPTFADHADAPGVRVLRSTGDAQSHHKTEQGGAVSILDSWHTDGSSRHNPSWISFLQAVDIPPVGRDTLFADMEAVLRRLSPALTTFLRSLHAVHSWGFQRPDAPPVEHPVVMEDISTGRQWLYVNRAYTRKIVGLTDDESDLLLKYLFEQAHVPECQLRVTWTPHTVVMWDNKTTQHYLVQDVSYPRVMHRVMVQASNSKV